MPTRRKRRVCRRAQPRCTPSGCGCTCLSPSGSFELSSAAQLLGRFSGAWVHVHLALLSLAVHARTATFATFASFSLGHTPPLPRHFLFPLLSTPPSTRNYTHAHARHASSNTARVQSLKKLKARSSSTGGFTSQSEASSCTQKTPAAFSESLLLLLSETGASVELPALLLLRHRPATSSATSPEAVTHPSLLPHWFDFCPTAPPRLHRSQLVSFLNLQRSRILLRFPLFSCASCALPTDSFFRVTLPIESNRATVAASV